jgi:hypothetical protein
LAQSEIRVSPLHAFETGSALCVGLAGWTDYYNRASEHPSVYVIEEKRLC